MERNERYLQSLKYISEERIMSMPWTNAKIETGYICPHCEGEVFYREISERKKIVKAYYYCGRCFRTIKEEELVEEKKE